jgi:hypothetical protein
MHSSGSGSGDGKISAQQLSKYIQDKGGNEVTSELIALTAENQGLNLDSIKTLIDSGVKPDQVLTWLEKEEITPTNLNDIITLLEDKKVSPTTINRLLDNGSDPKLMQEAIDSGVKINPDNVVGITRDVNGQIVWLETGNNSAGLQHILRHAPELEQLGITKEEIPNTLLNILNKEKPIGYVVGKAGTNRNIYPIDVNGTTKYVGISVGSNGFIVGAQSYGSNPPQNIIPLP